MRRPRRHPREKVCSHGPVRSPPVSGRLLGCLAACARPRSARRVVRDTGRRRVQVEAVVEQGSDCGSASTDAGRSVRLQADPLVASSKGIGRQVLRPRDPDIDVAMSIASNDEARVDIGEIEGEAHAVVIRVDVGQRSGPSIQRFPRSHAICLCKVTASVPGADCRGTSGAGSTRGAFSDRLVTNPQRAGIAAAPGAGQPSCPGSRGLTQGTVIAASEGRIGSQSGVQRNRGRR